MPENGQHSEVEALLRPEHLWVLWGLAVVLLAAATLRLGWRQGWWSPRAKLEQQPVSRYRINLNTADNATLALLPGIGEVKAARIVAYREERGPFRSLQDLLNIDGISESVLDRLGPYVTPEPETQEGDASPSNAAPSSP